MPDIYQLKISLQDAQPPIWRRFLVSKNVTLRKLHRIIQDVMGWTDTHLHEYEINGKRYGQPEDECGDSDPDILDEAKARIGQLIVEEGSRFLYVYDFGDDWVHLLELEKILKPEAGVKYPVCLAGERNCPPEDCGGVFGYQDFLAAFTDPTHPDHEEVRESLYEGWDPEEFDITTVNKLLWRIR